MAVTIIEEGAEAVGPTAGVVVPNSRCYTIQAGPNSSAFAVQGSVDGINYVNLPVSITMNGTYPTFKFVDVPMNSIRLNITTYGGTPVTATMVDA